MGRRILSSVPTTSAPQAASNPPVTGWPVAISHPAAGIQTRGGPTIGMIDNRAVTAAQKMAPGTPAANRPIPVSEPCTRAIRNEPLTVARMVEMARSASSSRACGDIGSSETAARPVSRPDIRK